MILQVVETLYCMEIAMFFFHYASPIRFSLVFDFIQQEFGVLFFQRILYIQKLCKGEISSTIAANIEQIWYYPESVI